jgi:Ser/Thr protein kinase RdoA (MazF antagonist)
MLSLPLELEFVESLVSEHFGIAARAVRLTGDRDENFRMQVKDGPGYVLKVLPAGESAVTAGLLPAVLSHLERVAVDLPVPRALVSRDGQAQLRFDDASGALRIATLCTFLPGKMLLTATRSPAQRRSCGQLLARLAGALRTFDHPATRREVVWDVAHVPKLASLIPKVPELPNVAFLQDFVARFTVEIAPRLARVRHQFVHNDFNARNILVDPDDESHVVGIIDFGDAVYTALVADLAVGVTGQLSTPETADDALREFVAAYCEIEPLLEEERLLLNWLIAGRIVLNTVLTAWARLQQLSGGHFDGFDATFFGWRVEFAKRLVSQSNPLIESAYVKSCFIYK